MQCTFTKGLYFRPFLSILVQLLSTMIRAPETHICNMEPIFVIWRDCSSAFHSTFWWTLLVPASLYKVAKHIHVSNQRHLSFNIFKIFTLLVWNPWHFSHYSS